MAAITYGRSAGGEIAVRKPAVKKTGFWSRIWIAMIEAQMRRAEREIELHRHLLPDRFRLAGRLGKPEDELPFIQR